MGASRTHNTRPMYLPVFLVLAAFTALEVGISYLDALPHVVKIVALVGLAATKVALVLLFFMHLKFDSRVFALPLALAALLVFPLILIMTLSPPNESGGAVSVAPSGAQLGAGASRAQTVDVSLTDYAIKLSTDHVSAGQVTFNVRNDAANVPHELTIIQTDMAPDRLPTVNGQVDTGPLNVLGSTEDLAAGRSATLTVQLEPGPYVLVCNIAGHYALGMYLAVTVHG